MAIKNVMNTIPIKAPNLDKLKQMQKKSNAVKPVKVKRSK